MANEFIARKGIVSLGNIQVSGSISATGGITITGSIASSSFAATASSADNFVVRQNLTGSNVLATGTITAQTLVVQTVTSSIVYSSGSNIFGNQLTNVQQMTGSLRVTGSGFVAGDFTSSGTGIFGGFTNSANTGLVVNTRLTDAGSIRVRFAAASTVQDSYISDFYSNETSYINFNRNNSTGNSYIAFGTGLNNTPTERVRITASGSIGIGTTTPTNGKLEIQQTCNAAALWVQTGGTTCCFTIADFRTGTNLSALQILGNGISSFGGGVGIGTATPGITYSETLQVSATTPSRLNLTHTNTSNQRQSDVLFTENATLQFQVGTILGSGTFNDQNWIRGVANIPLVLYTNDTERMRITSGGNVGINTSGPTATSTPHFFIGTNMSMFNGASDDSYIGSNFYYNSAWYYRTANAASMIQQNGGEVYFKSSAAVGTANGALTWCERMRLTCDGILAIKTTSTSTEANLFLGAQGTVEGGQLVLQKGTSCNCATHLDNYQNTFRVLSGTDTATTAAHMIVNHTTANVLIGTANDTGYRLTVAGGQTLLCHTSLPLTVAFGGNSAFVFTNTGGAGTDNYTISHNLVYGGSGGYEIKHNADARWIRVIAGSNGVQLCGTGTSWFSLSDERRKFIHNTIDNGIDVVNKWKPVIYRFCTDVETVRRSGVTAQSVLQTRPEAVSYDEHEDLYRVGYTELIPDLVSAIQQQTCIICQLKTCLGII